MKLKARCGERGERPPLRPSLLKVIGVYIIIALLMILYFAAMFLVGLYVFCTLIKGQA